MNQKRLGRIIKYMEDEQLKQIIISSKESIYYLTGIWVEPFERLFALFIDGSGESVLFGNEMFGLKPQEGLQIKEHNDNDEPTIDLAAALKPGKIGIDKFFPSKFLIGLLEKRSDITPVLSNSVDFARMQKDEEEIQAMRTASQINDMVMKKAIARIKKGVRENEISDFVEKSYMANGGDRSPEGQIASFGANAADPHHAPGLDIIKAGDCVVLDIFNPIHRYWCDMTRTVFFGSADEESKKVYETAKQANLAAEDMIRPGIPMSEIDTTARKLIENAGYGKYFTHRLGHGVGLECHEIPDNSSSNHTITKPGMVFSVEPGIYIPGKVGVRIEDLVLVTETGCEVFNKVSKELTVIK